MFACPWAQRRRTKRDFKQIIAGMVSKGWVEPGDRPLLVAEMNRLLERTSPTRWQKFMSLAPASLRHGEGDYFMSAEVLKR